MGTYDSGSDFRTLSAVDSGPTGPAVEARCKQDLKLRR